MADRVKFLGKLQTYKYSLILIPVTKTTPSLELKQKTIFLYILFQQKQEGININLKATEFLAGMKVSCD